MSAFDQIGKAHSYALLASSKALGAEVEFKHRDEKCVDLWTMPQDEEIAVVEENGIQTETRTRLFRIAVQHGFEATKNGQEPVIPGDKIVFQQRNYWVLEGGISKIGNGYIYEINTIQRKRLASGIN